MASGVELIAGTVNDVCFGPTVLFGLGGIFAEALRDVTYRYAPFGVDEALDMIGEIRGAAVLDGFRGGAPVDRAAIAQVLSRLSWLAADHADRIGEIDVNPLFATPQGVGRGGRRRRAALVALSTRPRPPWLSSKRPGRAPVGLRSRHTGTPLTMTASMPRAGSVECEKSAASITVSGSNSVMSAQLPGFNSPRSFEPEFARP